MKRIDDKKPFLKDAHIVAPFILGKILARKDGEKIIRGRISEVEIYSQNDSACHAFKGKTKRNAPIFEEGGTVYVYLCYGLFNLINIVCNKKDIPQGLLIRGVNNIFGSGRVAKYFNADKTLNGQNIFLSEDIWLEDDGFFVNCEEIKRLKRVGIGYARQEDQDKLWRLRIELKDKNKHFQ